MKSVTEQDPKAQAELFPKPNRPPAQGYRHTDPDTSRLAFEKITQNGQRFEVTNKILRFLRSRPDESFTYREIGQAIGHDPVDTMRRLNDLRHDHLVKNCPKRECRTNTHLMLTWKAVRL